MTRPRLSLRLACGTAPFLVLSACFLPGFDKVEATSTTGAGAGGTGGDGGAGGAVDACSVRWPPQEPGTSLDTDSVVITVAMRSIDIGEVDPTVGPGFDLDRACTCCNDCPAAQTCTPPAGILCDAPRGRDNAMSHFLQQLEQMLVSPVTTQSLNAEIGAGTWTVLMRIWGYNGLPDDDQVWVALYATGATTPPVWNGADVWPVRADSLVDMAISTDQARFVSDVAYVTGGVLVGTFGAAEPLKLSLTGTFDLRLTSAILSGKLEPADGTFKLSNATMGGLWAMPHVFQSLADLRDAGGNAVVCKEQPVYETMVKPLLCNLRDARPGFDTPLPCNSLSFGAAFASDPVVFGGIIPPPGPGTPCMPGFEPTGDTCPP